VSSVPPLGHSASRRLWSHRAPESFFPLKPVDPSSSREYGVCSFADELKIRLSRLVPSVQRALRAVRRVKVGGAEVDERLYRTETVEGATQVLERRASWSSSRPMGWMDLAMAFERRNIVAEQKRPIADPPKGALQYHHSLASRLL
jgi:hypothetical protein